MYVIVDVLKNTALAKTHDYVLKYNCGEGIKINGPPSTSRYTKWTHECYRYQPYAVADQMVSIYQQYLNMIINISTISQYDYQYINNISIWLFHPSASTSIQQSHAHRHEICQKICTTRFSGQKFYTLKVHKLRPFSFRRRQRKCKYR